MSHINHAKQIQQRFHPKQKPKSSLQSQLAKQSGFTLLEMLLAFSLVSLLFLALFASFNTIGRSWDAADNRMQKTSDQRLIMNWLRRQLQQAMVVKIKDDDGQFVYAFSGEDQRLRFAAPMLPFKDKGGVFLQELFLARKNGTNSLQLRYAPYRPDLSWEDAFADSEPVLVYDGLQQASFAYYGAENQEDEPSWESSWEDYPVYPLLLRLNISTESGEEWPELVVDLPQVDEYLNNRFARSPRSPLARQPNDAP
ncbi:MAG: prepilin-type N-terminal cleavage/methylation domain-containing protein [bacterium]